MSAPLSPLAQFETASKALEALLCVEADLSDFASYKRNFIDPILDATKALIAAYAIAREVCQTKELKDIEKRFQFLTKTGAEIFESHSSANRTAPSAPRKSQLN